MSDRAAAGPRRTQPRSTATRTATVCEAPVAARRQCHLASELTCALAMSDRAAAGPRRTQPRSTAQRTATVCEAPVAAPGRRHPAGHTSRKRLLVLARLQPGYRRHDFVR